MFRIRRRTALRYLVFGVSAAAADAFAACAPTDDQQRPEPGTTRGDAAPPTLGADAAPNGPNPIEIENRAPGANDWQPGIGGRPGADDHRRQIQGYASATSVGPGEQLDFQVTVNPAQEFQISIYRLGWYGGAGARHLLTSPQLPGVSQPVPAPDPATGLIACRWPAAWTVRVPDGWTSGLYVAVFTTTGGWRSCTPFVVRDARREGGLCVVLPFTTYQAYNQWPLDGRVGKSLYYGYQGPRERVSSVRARQVSFDRPYSGDGQPKHLDRDHDFIQWVERQSYDVTYATSVDLHAGRIDPTRYRGLIFCGHDEYWSSSMRQVAERAVAQGSSLAFLTANNVYWHIRMEPSDEGRPDRVVTCYKTDRDPGADVAGPTTYWRVVDRRGDRAEQGLLGVQYNGIVGAPQPLVVRASDHWFWAGCGVTDGDQIPGLVGGEADGLDPAYPRPAGLAATLLSASPYRTQYGARRFQNTHIYETPRRGIVFTAGTLFWPLALNRKGHRDARVQTATANLLDRMLGRSGRPS